MTGKPKPADFDVCWDASGVSRELLDPTFLEFENKRAAQKAKYKGEFFPSRTRADRSGRTFLEFFQLEKSTGLKKGIVQIELSVDSMIR